MLQADADECIPAKENNCFPLRFIMANAIIIGILADHVVKLFRHYPRPRMKALISSPFMRSSATMNQVPEHAIYHFRIKIYLGRDKNWKLNIKTSPMPLLKQEHPPLP